MLSPTGHKLLLERKLENDRIDLMGIPTIKSIERDSRQ